MPGSKKKKNTSTPTVRAVSPSAKPVEGQTLSPSAAQHATAKVVVGSRLTAVDEARLEQSAQMQAARMMAELKEFFDALADLQRAGLLKGIGGGDSTDWVRELANKFRPSMDLSSYMAGAARSDGKDPAKGGGDKPGGGGDRIIEKRWSRQNDDGSVTNFSHVTNLENGSYTTTEVWWEGDTEVLYSRHTDYADGSSDGEYRVRLDDGGYVSHAWAKDPNGNFVIDLFQTTDRHGNVVEVYDRAAARRRGLVRIPTEDETSELGRELGRRFSHGKRAGSPVVTWVNPGDPDLSGPTDAPRINPGESIVVNPATESAGKQAREISAERAKHLVQDLRDKVGGVVNPPGPSDGRKD